MPDATPEARKDILAIGTMYVDLDFLHFPFLESLLANKEVVGTEYEIGLGGSALNFARICSLLEMSTLFIGKVGVDMMATVLRQLITQNNIQPALVQSTDVQTNFAVHFVNDNGASIMTSSGSANQSISAEEVRPLFEEHIGSVRYVYLGGVLKMKSLVHAYQDMIKEATRRGVQVVLDHGRVSNVVTANDAELVRQMIPFVDVYLPSHDEFLQLWEVSTIEAGIKKVRQMSDATIVVKNSEDGAIGSDGKELVRAAAFPVEVINTVGAGDSFNAGFIKSHLEGYSLDEALRFACATAATRISMSRNEFSLEKVRDLLRASQEGSVT